MRVFNHNLNWVYVYFTNALPSTGGGNGVWLFRPDGMATFPGPEGLTILIRNHEVNPAKGGDESAFGSDFALTENLDRRRLYDAGKNNNPGQGGTTTIIYDTKNQKVVKQFLSLAGTLRNCAGGPTPWNSWLSCEEM